MVMRKSVKGKEMKKYLFSIVLVFGLVGYGDDSCCLKNQTPVNELASGSPSVEFTVEAPSRDYDVNFELYCSCEDEVYEAGYITSDDEVVYNKHALDLFAQHPNSIHTFRVSNTSDTFVTMGELVNSLED